MKPVMQTKCPACETTFALTAEQLTAREGLVRCGRCSAVFRADQYLLQTATRRRRARARAAASRSPAQPPPAKPSPPKPAGAREHKQTPAAPKISVQTVAHGTPAPPQPEEFVSPLLARLLDRKRRPTIPRLLWAAGTLILALTLLGQILYFYSSELARYRRLEPWVLTACQRLGCQVHARQDVARIELLRTGVVPHPAHANALRVSVSMVNRAGFSQPYPSIELTLTDSAGAAVARRTFSPGAYLAPTGTLPQMLPQVVVDVDVDIATPDPRPGGYEIRLVGQ